jgi:hypothetical protein
MATNQWRIYNTLSTAYCDKRTRHLPVLFAPSRVLRQAQTTMWSETTVFNLASYIGKWLRCLDWLLLPWRLDWLLLPWRLAAALVRCDLISKLCQPSVISILEPDGMMHLQWADGLSRSYKRWREWATQGHERGINSVAMGVHRGRVHTGGYVHEDGPHLHKRETGVCCKLFLFFNKSC